MVSITNKNVNYNYNDKTKVKNRLNELLYNFIKSKENKDFYITMQIVSKEKDTISIFGEVSNFLVYAYDYIISEDNYNDEIIPFSYWCTLTMNIIDFENKICILLKERSNYQYSLNNIEIEDLNEILSKYVFHFTANDNSSDKIELFYAGDSRFIHKKVSVSIVDLSKDNKSFFSKTKRKIDNKFKMQKIDFPNLAPMTIHSYRVGQGNFNIIACEKEKIVYDLGFTKNEDHNKPIFSYSKNVLKKLECDYIVISHTDMDHILGTNYINNNLYKNKKWYFPREIHNSKFACRIINHILKVNSDGILFIDKNNKISMANIEIFHGLGKSFKHCNKKNSLGLLVSLKNNYKSLLCGDCIYDSIDDKYCKAYNFLQVPHHCCELDGNKIDSFLKYIDDEKYACICVGKNKFGHPNKMHKNKLGKYFNIYQTSDYNEIIYDLIKNKIDTK